MRSRKGSVQLAFFDVAPSFCRSVEKYVVPADQFLAPVVVQCTILHVCAARAIGAIASTWAHDGELALEKPIQRKVTIPDSDPTPLLRHLNFFDSRSFVLSLDSTRRKIGMVIWKSW
jgi:hypothetical protein